MWEIAGWNFTWIALLSSLLGAVATVLARTLLKEIRTKDIIGINFLTMGATLALLSPFFYSFHLTPVSVGLVVLISIIDTAANYFFFKTFEQTEASVAAPILSLAPAFTFLFGWIFLGESTSPLTFIYAAAIIVLVVVFTSDFGSFRKFTVHTLTPALISSVLFGISAIPSKYLLSTLHAVNAPTLYMMRAGFIALFSLLIFNFHISGISLRQYRIIFFRGLFVIGQWILLYVALTLGTSGVAVTLANVTPVFVFLLGMLVLRERPTMRKMIAAVLILILSLFI